MRSLKIYAVLLILAAMLLAGSSYAPPTSAAECEDKELGCLEAGIPPFKEGQSVKELAAGGDSLIRFINSISRLTTGAIIVVGVIMIVAAGYVYMTAGGNAQRVGLAKSVLGTALLGIILAAVAWAFLNQISPQFTDVKKDPILELGETE